MARESAQLAKRALGKANELEAYLSLLEYRAGKTYAYKSVSELFKKLRST